MCKLIPLLTFCLLATPAVPAMAQDRPPSTQREHREQREQREQREHREDDGRRRGDRGDRRFEPITDEQWQEAETFLREHSSQRMKVFDTFRDANPTHIRQIERLRRGIYGKYRMLRRLEQENPELYDFMLTQMKLEDDIRTRIEAVTQEGGNPAEDEQTRSLTATYVNNVLQARTERLEHFRATLETQQSRLDEDRLRTESLITDQVTRWQSSPHILDEEGPPRDGPHGSGPPPRRGN